MAYSGAMYENGHSSERKDAEKSLRLLEAALLAHEANLRADDVTHPARIALARHVQVMHEEAARLRWLLAEPSGNSDF